MITKRIALIAVALLGLVVGSAAAAFVSSTSNGPNTFTTRAVTSRPTITGTRITTNSDCSAAVPAETIRQGTTYYACVQSVTDPAGIATGKFHGGATTVRAEGTKRAPCTTSSSRARVA